MTMMALLLNSTMTVAMKQNPATAVSFMQTTCLGSSFSPPRHLQVSCVATNPRRVFFFLDLQFFALISMYC